MSRDNTSKWDIGRKSLKKIFLNFSIALIFFAFLMIAANAYERPEFKDGLTEKWHPGNYCIPCHYTLLSTQDAQAISNGCKCHDYKPKNIEGKYKIDMAKIFGIHKDIICIRCHVGIKNQENVTAEDFHRVMSKVACLSCHTLDNGVYQKPQKRNCSDCHGGDPHVVHGGRLEKMCVTCHGEFGEKYTNETIEPSEKMKPPSVLQPEPVVTEGYTTIVDFIDKIIKSIMQVTR